jgi:hypothetical protein
MKAMRRQGQRIADAVAAVIPDFLAKTIGPLAGPGVLGGHLRALLGYLVMTAH